MPDWMKYNHVRRSVAATGMVVEARPGRACADCAHWRGWTPGDERCGVCVRWGGLTTRDGWAGACGGFVPVGAGKRPGGLVERGGAACEAPPRRLVERPGGLVKGVSPGGRGGVRLFDFG